MNQLSKAFSPYLRQHAHNPVHWYLWGEEAWNKALAENKCILVSIGYSTCHWCHVMAHESFEDAATAEFMNANFINIKIDREEFPDIDQVCMEVCRAITGGGGWPLNCFLTPDRLPFYAGTYFPGKPAYGRPSWLEVCTRIAERWQSGPAVILDQARRLAEIIRESDRREAPATKLVDDLITHAEQIVQKVQEQFDPEWGGFSAAPKFPSSHLMEALLDIYAYSGNTSALHMVRYTCERMMLGGIWDVVDGGWSRYATDRCWRIPHFEKMCYDNAFLIQLYSRLYAYTGEARFLRNAQQAIHFWNSQMSNGRGGWYTALDADSEGVEGKYYVWTYEEIQKFLGKDASWFCEYFSIEPEGNWEHGWNILYSQPDVVLKESDSNEESLIFQNKLKAALQLLSQTRKKRIPPSLDDKVLCDLNGYMIQAFAIHASVTIDAHVSQLVIQGMQYLKHQFENGNQLFHSSYQEQSYQPGYLDDYASAINACILTWQITWNKSYLDDARRWMDQALQLFYDEESNLIFFTNPQLHPSIIPQNRVKYIFDNATPSGIQQLIQGMMALDAIHESTQFAEILQKQMESYRTWILTYPQAFGLGLSNYLHSSYGLRIVKISGPDHTKYRDQLLKKNYPGVYFLPGSEEVTEFQLCTNFVCHQSVSTIQEIQNILEAQ